MQLAFPITDVLHFTGMFMESNSPKNTKVPNPQNTGVIHDLSQSGFGDPVVSRLASLGFDRLGIRSASPDTTSLLLEAGRATNETEKAET